MAAAKYEKSPTSLRPAHGCCKVRESSDIVAHGIRLLQVTNTLRAGLHMAVAMPLDAIRKVIDESVSDRFLISRRCVRGNMVSEYVQ